MQYRQLNCGWFLGTCITFFYKLYFYLEELYDFICFVHII